MSLQMVIAFSVCRALADQLDGNEEEHGKYRGMVVQYISYMSPRWYIRNFDQRGTRMIHLSYHDGEHYNSVRLKEDPSDGPARPIKIEADVNLSATPHQAKDMPAKSKGRAVRDAGSIKLVMAGSGCENAKKVEQVLLQVDGDVDAAIEFLIAEKETDDCMAQSSSLAGLAESIYECQRDGEDGSCETNQEQPKKSDKDDPSNISLKLTHDDGCCQAHEKKIPRNKVCPCGSKKKYKACCGAAKWRPSTKFVVSQTVDSRKSRKERKHGKKGGGAESVPSSGSDGGLPDMGALCI